MPSKILCFSYKISVPWPHSCQNSNPVMSFYINCYNFSIWTLEALSISGLATIFSGYSGSQITYCAASSNGVLSCQLVNFNMVKTLKPISLGWSSPQLPTSVRLRPLSNLSQCPGLLRGGQSSQGLSAYPAEQRLRQAFQTQKRGKDVWPLLGQHRFNLRTWGVGHWTGRTQQG